MANYGCRRVPQIMQECLGVAGRAPVDKTSFPSQGEHPLEEGYAGFVAGRTPVDKTFFPSQGEHPWKEGYTRFIAGRPPVDKSFFPSQGEHPLKEGYAHFVAGQTPVGKAAPEPTCFQDPPQALSITFVA